MTRNNTGKSPIFTGKAKCVFTVKSVEKHSVFYSLVQFFCSAVLPVSEYTVINRSLLRGSLQDSGNVTVLMEGFDEISQTHADKAAVILLELMKTEVERVWVTSRPVQKESL